MAHTIKIGSFAKHENSTAQPTVTGWAEFEITLKDGAELSSPVITLSADITDILNYNYAYLFGRYYWIREKTMERSGLCRLRLEVDVLATYKSQIGATSLYILRSSTASDGKIKDDLYKTFNDPLHTFDSIQYDADTSGVYIINVASGNSSAGSTTYQFSASEFSAFQNAMFAEYGPTDFDTTELAIKNALYNPLQYLISAFWFPGPGFTSTPVSDILIGKRYIGVGGHLVSNPIRQIGNTITLQKHDQAATRGTYLNFAPYSQYVIEYPPFGCIPLDAALLGDSSTLVIDIYIDATTGTARMIGHTSTDELIDITTEYVAAIPITQVGINANQAAGILTGIGTVVGAGITGLLDTVNSGLGSGLAMTGDAVLFSGMTASTFGGIGSRAKYQGSHVLRYRFWPVVAEDNARNGRPLCQVTTPATLGGFMIAQKGDVEITAPIQEVEEISRLLESGFYYE